jgi:hypothetical protein
MPRAGMHRTMTIVRRSDGTLLLHNVIALEEPEMKALEALGAPTYFVVPNGHHRQDILIWKKRYPAAKIVCPRGIQKKVEVCVPVDLFYKDVPADPAMSLQDLDGLGGGEGLLVVHSKGGTTLVSADVLCNQHGLKGVAKLMSDPIDCLSVPRIARWLMVKDKRALKGHLERLASSGVERVLVCHGKDVLSGATDAVRAAAARL